MKDVAGKGVLITGGAKGMGRLWADRFAKDGARLALWDIDKEGLNATKAQLEGAGAKVFVYPCDVSKKGQIRKAAQQTLADLDGVDVLVNNAGIVYSDGFVDTPDTKLEAIIQINLTAMMLITKLFLPQMIERGSGHIVNISSASGFVGLPNGVAYAASKWGAIGLTESLRVEMKAAGHKGIKFTLVCPSYVDTGMFEGAKAPLLTKVMRPETIVNKAYKAFKRDQFWVREPFMVKLTPALKELLPISWFDAVSDILGATKSMQNWKGHEKE